MHLRDLYASLQLDHLNEFVETGREEDLQLDFKTVSRSDLAAKDDRRSLARALSGFANSSGGLVVWGIDARKLTPDGPDCARDLCPIADARLFVNRLNEFTGSFVRPLVDGVQHRAIQTSGTEGYAVTLVPESDSGPHMALGGEGRYFKRSGDRFYPLEHFDLEDMFGRRRRPKLELRFRVRPKGSTTTAGGGTYYKGQVVITAHNIGRGSARALYLGLSVNPPYSLTRLGLDGNGSEALVRLPYGDTPQTWKLAAPPHLVIHPGTSHDIAAIDVQAQIGRVPANVMVRYEYAAEDVPLQEGKLDFSGHDMVAAILGKESRPVA